MRNPRAARHPHRKDGRIEVLAEQWEGRKLNAPGDLAVSKSDHVYFTDPAFGEQADHRELDFYGVYHLPPKGPLKLVAKPAGRPNGIALSPNGRLLYVTNSTSETCAHTTWTTTATLRASACWWRRSPGCRAESA